MHNSNEHITPLRIGVIGYSAQHFDEDQARQILLSYFRKLMLTEGTNIEVVSGLTWLGIPGLAYEVATALDLKTVGIACRKAADYECFPCDRTLIIGDNWGDESETFLRSIDLLVRVGGGKQSHRECAIAHRMSLPVDEFELDVVKAAA